MSHIFVSYVREDQKVVDKLVSELKAKGALVWLDRNEIDPGEPWQLAIAKAIETGNFFLACFSTNSVNKPTSWMNEELIEAIGQIRLRPYGKTWFIPVLLDRCTVPRLPIGPHMTLRDLQWVSLAEGWEEGVTRIASITLDLEKKSLEKE